MMNYFNKMRGVTTSAPMVSFSEIIWSWIGAFIGIGAVSYINYNMIEKTDFVMVIGSFGASAVLIYGAIRSPLAQPRNLVGGHIISALIGVTCYKLFSSHMWLASCSGSCHGYCCDACHKDAASPRRSNVFNCGYRQ